MPASKSVDLRRAVVEAYERGEGSYAELGRIFGVHPNTVRNWVHRALENDGKVAAKPQGGWRYSKVKAEHVEVIRQFVEAKSDATREEIQEHLHEQTGLEVCLTTISEHLDKLGLSRKKSRYERKSRI